MNLLLLALFSISVTALVSGRIFFRIVVLEENISGLFLYMFSFVCHSDFGLNSAKHRLVPNIARLTQPNPSSDDIYNLLRLCLGFSLVSRDNILSLLDYNCNQSIQKLTIHESIYHLHVTNLSFTKNGVENESIFFEC